MGMDAGQLPSFPQIQQNTTTPIQWWLQVLKETVFHAHYTMRKRDIQYPVGEKREFQDIL